MIVTVGDASPRHARGHIWDICVKWKHFLNEVADQTGIVRGRIERVEMSLEPGFNMIISVIVSICRRLVLDTSPIYRSRSCVRYCPRLICDVVQKMFPFNATVLDVSPSLSRRRVANLYDHMETRL